MLFPTRIHNLASLAKIVIDQDREAQSKYQYQKHQNNPVQTAKNLSRIKILLVLRDNHPNLQILRYKSQLVIANMLVPISNYQTVVKFLLLKYLNLALRLKLKPIYTISRVFLTLCFSNMIPYIALKNNLLDHRLKKYLRKSQMKNFKQTLKLE